MKYLFVFVVCVAFSCKKNQDYSCKACTSESKKDDALIVDGGLLAGDGCGWLIHLPDSVYYHPDVFDTSFQHNGLPVKINYQFTSEAFTCGINAMHIPVIHVNSIIKE